MKIRARKTQWQLVQHLEVGMLGNGVVGSKREKDNIETMEIVLWSTWRDIQRPENRSMEQKEENSENLSLRPKGS